MRKKILAIILSVVCAISLISFTACSNALSTDNGETADSGNVLAPDTGDEKDEEEIGDCDEKDEEEIGDGDDTDICEDTDIVEETGGDENEEETGSKTEYPLKFIGKTYDFRTYNFDNEFRQNLSIEEQGDVISKVSGYFSESTITFNSETSCTIVAGKYNDNGYYLGNETLTCEITDINVSKNGAVGLTVKIKNTEGGKSGYEKIFNTDTLRLNISADSDGEQKSLNANERLIVPPTSSHGIVNFTVYLSWYAQN